MKADLPSSSALLRLRGLTSIIGWRMEAHYKISALCLSIRVTERGLVVLLFHSKPSTCRLTKTGSQGSAGEQEIETKPAEMLLKRLICNLLTLVAHQGYRLSKAELSLCENLQFLTSADKRSQWVSFTNGQRNCPEEGETSALSLSGIRECKYTTNKFLLEHNGGLWRQEDEMRKGGWGSQNKSRCCTSPPIGFKEILLHLISCPRIFKLQHKMSPGEFRQWAREETSERKRRGRKMRA